MASNGNWSADATYDAEHVTEAGRYIYIIVCSLLFIAGLLGNLAILVTVGMTKRMRNPHYFLIANLAVADLLYSGYNLPWILSTLIVRRYPVPNSTICTFNGAMIQIPLAASTLSLLAINLNRYLNISHKQIFARVFSGTLASSLIGCGLPWLVSVALFLPVFSGAGRIRFARKFHGCMLDATYNPPVLIITILVCLFIPAVSICLCNLAIWRYARKVALLTHEDHSRDSRRWSFFRSHDWNASSHNDADVVDRPDTLTGKTRGNGSVTSSSSSTSSKAGSKDGEADETQSQPDVPPPPAATKIQKVNFASVTTDELALLRTVITISLCFGVCAFPTVLIALVPGAWLWPTEVHLAAISLLFTNSCLNCVLYGLIIPSFQKALMRLFGYNAPGTSSFVTPTHSWVMGARDAVNRDEHKRILAPDATIADDKG